MKKMKMMVMVVAAGLVLLATGCATRMANSSVQEKFDPTGKIVVERTNASFSYQESNLARKSLAAGGAVSAMKIITTADPESGSFSPTVIFGFGTFYLFDLAPGASAYFHDVQKSAAPWSSSMGSDTTVLIMGQDNANTKVEISNPALIIDCPFLKVQNPAADGASTKTVVTPNAPKGAMPDVNYLRLKAEACGEVQVLADP